MATIDVFTKDRMLELEASTIVDADVVGDNLILVRHDGATVNAGSVRGAKGDNAAASIAEKANAEPPSSYPSGISTFQTTTGAVSWPADNLTVMTVKENSLRGFQLATQKATLNMWFRIVVDEATWGAWAQFTTKSYVDGQVSLVSEIGNAVNLNDYIYTGRFVQSTDVEAAAGTNYPEPKAGLLEVSFNGNNMVWQRYTPYGSNATKFYTRANYNGVWSAWQRYDPNAASLALVNTQMRQL